MGGVAHKPWRSLDAERVLTGAPANAQTFKAAAEAAVKAAVPQKHNAFKIEMAKRAVARILNEVAGRKQGGAA
jgi:xanthine dehydrogenase YagS FAD-binding subunit